MQNPDGPAVNYHEEKTHYGIAFANIFLACLASFVAIADLTSYWERRVMTNTDTTIYQIKIKGHLNESWTDCFEGLTFTHEEDGTTTLRGEIVDQSALHGLLKKVRDLGLPLISVNQVGPDPTEPTDPENNWTTEKPNE